MHLNQQKKNNQSIASQTHGQPPPPEKACTMFKRVYDDIVDYGIDESGFAGKGSELQKELEKGGDALTSLYEALHVAKSYSAWDSR